MLKYSSNLKDKARRLRAEMTDSERVLWARLRRKQVHSVHFYRQKPIGNHIVDFYAPKAKLVVEADGSQHEEIPLTPLCERGDWRASRKGEGTGEPLRRGPGEIPLTPLWAGG